MTPLKMLSTDDKLAEIRRLYFQTTKQTIQDDLAKALDLLKSMHSEEERERATVYMEGMAQMRSDWARESKPRAGGPSRAGGQVGLERQEELEGLVSETNADSRSHEELSFPDLPHPPDPPDLPYLPYLPYLP